MKKSKLLRLLVTFSIIGVLLSFVLPKESEASVSNGGKFLGNVINSNFLSNFNTYWDQVTPENATKWGSVESTRNVMDWSTADSISNYASNQGIPFKFHTLVWGSQEPAWVSDLSATEQLAEVTQWIQSAGLKYSTAEFVEVVNEPLHAPPSYKDAIGGDGSTGWDWVIWSFEQAKKEFPNSKLLINDYGIINDITAARDYVEIVNLLKERDLIDGIGIQCHYFNIERTRASSMNKVLDTLAATGLPIYVTERYAGSDKRQLSLYQDRFPVLWEHPAVKGVTLWGYQEGKTWSTNAHLINSDGTERPAMQWLKAYISDSGL